MAVTHLLDVNVLLALWWERHLDHEPVRAWFQQNVRSWATTPVTQLGFVRLASHPKITEGQVSPSRAMEAMERSVSVPSHVFWPADIEFVSPVRSACHKLLGGKQTTDAYLVALAERHGGRLATLDRGIAELVTGRPTQRLVEVIEISRRPQDVQ